MHPIKEDVDARLPLERARNVFWIRELRFKLTRPPAKPSNNCMTKHETFLQTKTARTDSPHPSPPPTTSNKQTHIQSNQATKETKKQTPPTPGEYLQKDCLPVLEELTKEQAANLQKESGTKDPPNGHCEEPSRGMASSQEEGPEPTQGTGQQMTQKCPSANEQPLERPSRPPYCRECQNTGGICQVDTEDQGSKLGYLQMQVGKTTIKALVDTGASISVISKEMFKRIENTEPTAIIHRNETQKDTKIALADGQTVNVLEKVTIQLKLFEEQITETFFVLPQTQITILGWPFFAHNDLTIDCKRRLLIRDSCTFQINRNHDRRKRKEPEKS